MTTILVIHHSPSPTLQRIAEEVIGAAKEAADLINAELSTSSGSGANPDVEGAAGAINTEPSATSGSGGNVGGGEAVDVPHPESSTSSSSGANPGDASGEGGEGERAASVEVIERAALEPDIDELLAADAVILGTSANFGYISGALKHYFDTTFNAAHEPTRGMPVSWWIRGGFDTTGAEKAMRTLTTGMNWELAAQPVEFTGDVDPQVERLREMAQAVVGAAVGL